MLSAPSHRSRRQLRICSITYSPESASARRIRRDPHIPRWNIQVNRQLAYSLRVRITLQHNIKKYLVVLVSTKWLLIFPESSDLATSSGVHPLKHSWPRFATTSDATGRLYACITFSALCISSVCSCILATRKVSTFPRCVDSLHAERYPWTNKDAPSH